MLYKSKKTGGSKIKKFSLRYKIALTIIVLVLIVVLSSNVVFIVSGHNKRHHTLLLRAQIVAQAQAAAMASAIWEYNQDAAVMALKGLLQDTEFHHATVYDDANEVFASIKQKFKTEQKNIVKVVKEVFFEASANQFRKIGRVELYMTADALKSQLFWSILQTIGEILLLLVLVVPSIIVAIGKFTHPIEDMTKIMHQCIAGNYDLQINEDYLQRNDEIGAIAQSLKQDIQQRRDELKLLETSASISREWDLKKLLDKITAATTSLVKTERSSIFLYDSDEKNLYSQVAEGLSDRIKVSVDQGIVGKTFTTKEGIIVENAQTSEDFFDKVDEKTHFVTKNIISVPMLNKKGDCIGVLQSLNKKESNFNERDQKRLMSLASQAAIAVENAKLTAHLVEKEKLKQAMEIGRNIQKSLLPLSAPESFSYDLNGWNLSCDETGGDYYDFFELPNGKLALTIGDVTGHGIGAAFFMATGRAFLRALAYKSEDIVQLITLLNVLLEQDMEEDKFMTLFYSELGPDLKLCYANAGHDNPLLYRKASGEFEELESTGIPLGILDDFEYEEADPIQIEPGDMLILSTDGITEAMNPQGEEFGQERFKQIIRESLDKTSQETIDRCYQVVKEFCNGASQRDDLTLVVVKFDK